MRIFKRLSVVALMAFISANAFSAATGTLSIEGGVVKATPGATEKIDILLTNTDDEITIMQFDLTVPTGVTIGTKSSTITKYREISTVSGALKEGTTYRFILETEDEETYVTGTSGAIVSLSATYASDFAGGTAKITGIKVGGKANEVYDDVNFTFDVSSTVDITLANINGYNSYCSDKDLDVSGVTDAEFYVVKTVSASEATLAKVTEGIPAGEGFLILGKGTANISVPVAATTPTATGTKLKGVTAATAIEAGNFILSSDGTKFVPCTAGTLPANKAYLPKSEVPASAKEFLMIVDETVVTGISGVQAENNANGRIYNLNGSRVSNPQKGVYIMNGRKVIVK